jgi:hypothetical protein
MFHAVNMRFPRARNGPGDGAMRAEQGLGARLLRVEDSTLQLNVSHVAAGEGNCMYGLRMRDSNCRQSESRCIKTHSLHFSSFH